MYFYNRMCKQDVFGSQLIKAWRFTFLSLLIQSWIIASTSCIRRSEALSQRKRTGKMSMKKRKGEGKGVWEDEVGAGTGIEGRQKNGMGWSDVTYLW